jgi:hypothetical protein
MHQMEGMIQIQTDVKSGTGCSMSFDELVSKADRADLSKSEVRYLTENIDRPGLTQQSLYAALMAIGKFGTIEDMPPVIRLMNSTANPMIASQCLRNIVRYWGASSQVMPFLVDSVSRVAFDEDGNLQLAAIQLSKDVLAKSLEKDLLRLLLNIAEGEHKGESDLLRIAAYEAILAAVERKIRFMPIVRDQKPAELMDTDVLAKAHALAST